MGQLFIFNGHNLTTITDLDGKHWFVGQDVCAVLGLSGNFHVAMRKLDDDEKGRRLIPTPGGKQECRIVNEAGLYHHPGNRQPDRSTAGSTHQVLPMIMQSGAAQADCLGKSPAGS